MTFVLEVNGGLLEPAEPFHKAFFVGIDENVGDRRILEQRLDRAEANHLIDQIFDEGLQFALIKRDALDSNIVADIDTKLPDQFLPRHSLKQRQVELIDDPRVDLYFFVQQCGALSNQVPVKPLVLRGSGNAGPWA